MNKERYLAELTSLLNEEEYQKTQEATEFYTKFITSLINEGQTMEQIISSLGTPQQVSDDLILDEEEPFVLPELPEVKTEIAIEPEIIENNEAAFGENESQTSEKKVKPTKKEKPAKKSTVLSGLVSFLFSLIIIFPFWLIVGFILFAIVWVLIAVVMSGFASGLILSTFALLAIGFFLLLLSGTILLNRMRRTISNVFKGGY